jgi:hypothetical protein
MKFKTYLAVISAILIFISCTPELEDDYIRIDFKNLSRYQRYYSDTSMVLVKVNYSAVLSRNSVPVEDTVYTANALYYRAGDNNPWIYYCRFGNDSNITAVKRDRSRLYFKYQDTLLYSVNLLLPADSVYASEFSSSEFPDTLSYIGTDSVSTSYIDSLNSVAKWYKPYRQWKDEIINLYR